MNPAAYGLLSSLIYGVGDFLSGMASRRDSPLRVAALTHPLSALALGLLAFLLHQPLPPASDLWWGVAGGLVGLGAILAFYRALALGPMGAVSVSAGALSAAVPVAIGIIGGETLGLNGWLGALAVLIGTAMLSLHPGERGGNGVTIGILAGIGFGFFFTLLGQAHSAQGILWTLAVARLASALVILPIAAKMVGLRPQAPALVFGSAPFDMAGNLLYLLAVQGGGLAIGALLSSLYPAFTTLLAVVVLRERLKPMQWVGVVIAMIGAVLLSAK
ncbi:DMT family transporter [Deinococcus sp.]|uniref:DMT family transporter n=1 Tax=Deinococcus sp. TaxID=47478 RepID=UPI0025C11238|nr:DMT family transporter [Deinococcus sp.]